MKHYMVLHRIKIAGHFKVAIKIFNKEVSEEPLSVTIIDEVPKGLQVGSKYNLSK